MGLWSLPPFPFLVVSYASSPSPPPHPPLPSTPYPLPPLTSVQYQGSLAVLDAAAPVAETALKVKRCRFEGNAKFVPPADW